MDLPALRRFSRHAHFSASPPNMQASLDPMVDVPGLASGTGEFQSSAIM